MASLRGSPFVLHSMCTTNHLVECGEMAHGIIDRVSDTVHLPQVFFSMVLHPIELRKCCIHMHHARERVKMDRGVEG